MANESNPDPEVRPKAERRRFSAKYKLDVLRQADECVKDGEIGALLRREGLYSSQLHKWRNMRKAGRLGGGQAKKATDRDAEKRLEKMEAENRKLRSQLQQAQSIIDVQKKLCDLLDLSSENTKKN